MLHVYNFIIFEDLLVFVFSWTSFLRICPLGVVIMDLVLASYQLDTYMAFFSAGHGNQETPSMSDDSVHFVKVPV